MFRNTLIAVMVFGSFTFGCGHGSTLVPDKSAQVILGAETAAVAVVKGVRCSANGSAWRGIPKDLGSVTAIKVRITNNSGKSIRLLYEDFVLVGETGQKYHPMPPVQMPADADSAPTVRPIYTYEKFFVARALRDVYRTLEPWPTSLPRDDDFYQREWPKWGPELPSRDMRAKGMPEGVLADGGVVSGFLYFDGDTGREDKVIFTADLAEGEQDGRVALIKIPFRVE